MDFPKAKSDGTFLKSFEFTLYIILIILGFYIAFFVRFEGTPSPVNIKPFYHNIPYIILASIFIFNMAKITSTYKKTLLENVVIIASSVFLIDIITVAVMFFNRGFAFPRSVFLLGYVVQCALMVCFKILVLQFIKHHSRQQKALIISPAEGSNLLSIDFLSNGINVDKLESVCDEVNQKTFQLIDRVDKVYVDSEISNEDKIELIRYCSIKNKTLYIIPSLLEIALMNSKIRNYGDAVLLRIEPLGLSFEQKAVKRIMDVILSFAGLILTAPLFLVIALVIKLDDKGPVFYNQERLTEGNKVFKLYKFRTMKVDAEKYTGPMLALKDDPRITRVGKILRSTRLDELPQLINVLKGDMSIVGPRPERPHFAEQFNEEIEEFKYRVFVKAGITGLAQVLGRYTTSPKNKAKIDLLYIKNYSLLLDIKILLSTIKVIFKKQSSMGVQENDMENIKLKLLKQFNIKPNQCDSLFYDEEKHISGIAREDR
jgi:exopolysaccharide biosynthesis polyprenyl glycosylphosphotransferase